MKTNRVWSVSGMAVCLALAAWLATDTARAQAVAAAPDAVPVRASEVGHAARGWLELQRSNQAAAPALPMLGVEAGLAYQRYMESFKSKIPVSYGSSLNDNGNQLHVDYSNSNGNAQN